MKCTKRIATFLLVLSLASALFIGCSKAEESPSALSGGASREESSLPSATEIPSESAPANDTPTPVPSTHTAAPAQENTPTPAQTEVAAENKTTATVETAATVETTAQAETTPAAETPAEAETTAQGEAQEQFAIKVKPYGNGMENLQGEDAATQLVFSVDPWVNDVYKDYAGKEITVKMEAEGKQASTFTQKIYSVYSGKSWGFLRLRPCADKNDPWIPEKGVAYTATVTFVSAGGETVTVVSEGVYTLNDDPIVPEEPAQGETPAVKEPDDSYDLWFSEPYIAPTAELPEKLIYTTAAPVAEWEPVSPLEDCVPYKSFLVDNRLQDILIVIRDRYADDEYLLLKVTIDDDDPGSELKEELREREREIRTYYSYTTRLRTYLVLCMGALHEQNPEAALIDLCSNPLSAEFPGYIIDGAIVREKVERDYERVRIIGDAVEHYIEATVHSAVSFKPQFDSLGILNYVRGGTLYIVIKIGDFEKLQLENAEHLYFRIADRAELP